MRLAHSSCAFRLVPAKLCHLRRRLPVAGSRSSITIARWPGPGCLAEEIVDGPPKPYYTRPLAQLRTQAGIVISDLLFWIND
jgi:hypothetical protein